MRRRDAGQRGQALVELAVMAVLLMLLSLGAVQFGMIYSAKFKVTHAAREGARYASVHASNADADVQQHVLDAVPDLTPPLAPGDITVSAPGGRLGGQPIVVTVNYSGTPRLPLVGAMLPNPIAIRGEVRMRIEQ